MLTVPWATVGGNHDDNATMWAEYFNTTDHFTVTVDPFLLIFVNTVGDNTVWNATWMDEQVAANPDKYIILDIHALGEVGVSDLRNITSIYDWCYSQPNLVMVLRGNSHANNGGNGGFFYKDNGGLVWQDQITSMHTGYFSEITFQNGVFNVTLIDDYTGTPVKVRETIFPMNKEDVTKNYSVEGQKLSLLANLTGDTVNQDYGRLRLLNLSSAVYVGLAFDSGVYLYAWNDTSQSYYLNSTIAEGLGAIKDVTAGDYDNDAAIEILVCNQTAVTIYDDTLALETSFIPNEFIATTATKGLKNVLVADIADGEGYTGNELMIAGVNETGTLPALVYVYNALTYKTSLKGGSQYYEGSPRVVAAKLYGESETHLYMVCRNVSAQKIYGFNRDLTVDFDSSWSGNSYNFDFKSFQRADGYDFVVSSTETPYGLYALNNTYSALGVAVGAGDLAYLRRNVELAIYNSGYCFDYGLINDHATYAFSGYLFDLESNLITALPYNGTYLFADLNSDGVNEVWNAGSSYTTVYSATSKFANSTVVGNNIDQLWKGEPHINDLNSTLTKVSFDYVDDKLNFTVSGSGAAEIQVNCTSYGEPDKIYYPNGTEITGSYTDETCIYTFNVDPDLEVMLDFDENVRFETYSPTLSLPNTAINFSVTYSSDIALSGHIHSNNITGTMHNDTWAAITGFSSSVTAHTAPNSTCVVAWQDFVNDTNGNWWASPTQYLLVQSVSAVKIQGLNTSEIRGMFVHCATWNDAGEVNWTAIADNCEKYGINAVFGEFLTIGGAYYDSDVSEVLGGAFGDQLGYALGNLTSRGIKVWVSMDVLLSSYNATMAVYNGDGGIDESWTSPSNSVTKAWIKSLVEELAENYPEIEGFLFDYIRFNTINMDYSEAARLEFIADTGLSDVVWTTDVVGVGRYFNDFVEWRATEVTDLVGEMRGWMVAKNPDLKFGAAVFAPYTSGSGSESVWTYWIGQDTADMVAKGYLDMVCPMIYTNETDTFNDRATWSAELFNGAFNGQVQFVPIISNCEGSVTKPITTEAFSNIVNETRNLYCNGFITWAYGGDGATYTFPDIEPYYDVLNLYERFTMSGVTVENLTATSFRVSWTTSLATTGKVEYSENLLFTESVKYSSISGIYYNDVEYSEGSFVTDESPTVTHSLTVPDIDSGYYFRVLSSGSNNDTLFTSISTFLENIEAESEDTYIISITPTNPQNDTYTNSTIPNSATLTGNGTSQEWHSNVYNLTSTSYLYAANLTSTNTTVTIAVNGTYRMDFWASDAEGSTDTANVTFTVAIPPEPTPTPTINEPSGGGTITGETPTPSTTTEPTEPAITTMPLADTIKNSPYLFVFVVAVIFILILGLLVATRQNQKQTRNKVVWKPY
jgi:uncharacterized lipoprotein YddW (UPF0748 family)